MRSLSCSILLSAVLSVSAVQAAPASQDAAARGLEIARKAEDRASGYHDSRGEATMIIRTGDGDQATRKMHARNMETDDGSRSLTVVDEPKDVAGTALLTHSHDEGSDDQWLYLPALARVKRIAGGNRSGAFMGSEFSYEDFTAQPVAKFDFKLLREETLDGTPCYVVERHPKPDTHSTYSKHIAWIDRDDYRTLKVDFYNRNGQKLKTLIAEDFKHFDNGQWRARKLTMTNHQTGGVSILRWHDIEFDNGFTERDFSIAALKRAH